MQESRKMNMVMAMGLIFHTIFFSNLCYSSAQDISSDRLALIDFMRSVDPQNKVLLWNITSLSPCGDPVAWPGISCKKPEINRVTFLELTNKNLSRGTIAPNTLSRLDQLRVLRLINLSLSGSIPSDISACSHVKKLILSGNNFTGTIPGSLGKFAILDRLMLNNNQFSGEIPRELADLQELQTLRLDYNFLSGLIPNMSYPKMQEFSVSHNRLQGRIPQALAVVSDDPAAFAGNLGLCGPPTSNACPPPSEKVSPSSPDSGTQAAGGAPPPSPAPRRERKRYTTVNVIIIVIFSVAILVFIILLLTFYRRKNENPASPPPEVKSAVKKDVQQSIDSASLQFPEPGAAEGVDSDAGKLVFVDGKAEAFELKELLRASAEMLGKGTVGTTYKAVMGDGVVFAVKRLLDRSLTGKAEFEKQLEMVGKLKHPNILPLVAYYFYAQEEKLLVYDFLPNKNLYVRLHANRRTNDRVPLVWSDRLQIAYSVAQGLEYLHQECQAMPHGNLKSTNIIFDESNQPCIADFGLLPFVDVHNGPQASGGYRAPEMFVAKKVTHKADVYSFGVMLLELLTGRVAASQDRSVDLPRWVNSTVREEWTAEVFDYELAGFRRSCEEEMVYLLRIALDCVASNPEQRPRMAQVVKLIEDIKSPEQLSSDASFSNEPRSIDLSRAELSYSFSTDHIRASKS